MASKENVTALGEADDIVYLTTVKKRILNERQAESNKEQSVMGRTYEQWSSSDDERFFPTSRVVREIPPACYDILWTQSGGYYFQKIPVLSQDLLRLPDPSIEEVLDEIRKFWDLKDRFKEFNLLHKRGIMLYGPPGTGKSCLIQLLIDDIVQRGGICVKFGRPESFVEGMRFFREIEPNKPVVVLMEDLDSTLQIYDESVVLNILDGVNQIEHAVFLATTNHPEKLGPRIMNRPSRFDRRFLIDLPSAEVRRAFLAHLSVNSPIDLDRWVKDTTHFSIAHLKELFVGVVMLGQNYKDAIRSLKDMNEKDPEVASGPKKKKAVGFKDAAISEEPVTRHIIRRIAGFDESYGDESYGDPGVPPAP